VKKIYFAISNYFCTMTHSICTCTLHRCKKKMVATLSFYFTCMIYKRGINCIAESSEGYT